jgi:hypothetical protein
MRFLIIMPVIAMLALAACEDGSANPPSPPTTPRAPDN